MNLTPEQKEQIKEARAVLDAIESGGEIEVRRDKGPSGLVWYPEPALGCLNVLSYYRAKPKPKPTSRFYTVEELIKAGARYVTTGGSVYTIVLLSPTTNSLTVMGTSPVVRAPEWFADTLCKWSANGQEWRSFVKED